MSYFVLSMYSVVYYLNLSFSDLITSVREERVVFCS